MLVTFYKARQLTHTDTHSRGIDAGHSTPLSIVLFTNLLEVSIVTVSIVTVSHRSETRSALAQLASMFQAATVQTYSYKNSCSIFPLSFNFNNRVKSKCCGTYLIHVNIIHMTI